MSSPKPKRQGISLATKIEILDRLKNGEGSTSLGKIYGLNESTVRTIKRHEDAIRNAMVSGTNVSAKYSSYTRDYIRERMEKALVMWLKANAQKGIPVDQSTLKQNALRIYEQMKELDQSSFSQSTRNKSHTFTPNPEWLYRFLRRHNINIMDDNNIKDDINNKEDEAEELMPARCRPYVAKSQKCVGDHKPAMNEGERFDDLILVDIDELLVDKDFSEDEIVQIALNTFHSTAINDSDKSAPLASGLQHANKSENHVVGKDPNLVRAAQRDAKVCVTRYSCRDEPAPLTASVIREGLKLANKLENYFVLNDPNAERAAQFQHDLKLCMAPYKKLYEELAKTKSQRLITEFALKCNDAKSERHHNQS